MAISYNDYKLPGSYSPVLGSYGSAWDGKNIPGTQIPVLWSSQIESQKSKIDPLGINEYNPITGRNRQGRTRGEQAAADLKANTSLVSTTKSEPIAKANEGLLAQTSALSTQAADASKNILKGFEDYLNEAKALQSQTKETIAADAETYRNAPKKLELELSDAVKNFASSTGAINEDYKTLNAEQKLTNERNIAQLAEENARYEAAAGRVAQEAVAAAQRRSNAQQSATGTPRSGSGYWNQVAAKNYSDVMLPVQKDIAGMRINQLTSYITPLQQSQYAQELSRLTNLELPVANTMVQLGITNANQLAQFSASLAGRSLDEQIRYLSTLGIPLQAAQSVAQSLSALAASLPASLAQIQGIDERNTMYGLAGDYQSPQISLPAYTPNQPSYNPPNTNGPYRPAPGYNDYDVQAPMQRPPPTPVRPAFQNSYAPSLGIEATRAATPGYNADDWYSAYQAGNRDEYGNYYSM